jgi:predicted porin
LALGKPKAPVQTLENLEMKKTLVALAALAATSAFAQSSVTAYGIVDVAYKNYEITNANGAAVIKSRGISDGTNAGDRVGFRGVEDLGNGRNANFVAEFGITVADPAGISNRAGAEGAQVYGLANTGNTPVGAYSAGSNTRQAYVAYGDAKMGEVRLGYQYTELYNTSTNTGFWIGQEQAGGITHKLSNGDFGGTRGNAIVYVSPKLANTTVVTAQYGAGTGRDTNETDLVAGQAGFQKNNIQRNSIGALFEQGPLRVGGAYTTVNVAQNLGNAAGSTYNAYGVATAQSATSRAYDYKSKLQQLNVSYDLGFAKPVVQYYKGTKNISSITSYAGTQINGADNANGLMTLAAGEYTYKALTYGATVPYGAATFFAVGGKGTIDGATAATNGVATASGRNADYRQHQYGVRYAVSKRTTAYVATGKQTDSVPLAGNATASYNIGTNSAQSKYSAIGLMHAF